MLGADATNTYFMVFVFIRPVLKTHNKIHRTQGQPLYYQCRSNGNGSELIQKQSAINSISILGKISLQNSLSINKLMIRLVKVYGV
jgi:hypothetical protein